MTDMYERNLIEAGDRLGELMSLASEKEKEILRDMKSRVNEYAEGAEKEGKYIDRSAVFAAGIIANPEINNENLIYAAKEYVEADYMFVKNFKEAEV